MSSAIIALGLLYFIGHLLTHFFKRTKVPDVLILIIFGILVGPVFHFVDPQSIGVAGNLFTTIALIVILFEGGLGLEVSTLIRSAAQAFKLTTIFFVATAATIFSILYFGFEYSPMASALTGFICGGTSSAVVIPLIGALKTGKEASTILIIESALTDVLCIVFTLGVLRSYDSGDFEIGKIIGSLISSLVLASVIGILGGLVWLRLLNWVRTEVNTQFATFAFMFIVYGVAELLHFSGPIAALAFGIILGNNHLVIKQIGKVSDAFNVDNVGIISDAEKKLYKEIVFLLKIFFFIYIGISIPVEQMFIVAIAATIVIAIYILRPFATKILVRHRITPYDNMIISIMVPKGLAAAVLAGLPQQYGMIEGADIQAITYYIVLLSIVFTSVLIPLAEKTRIGLSLQRFFGVKELTTDKKEIDKNAE